LAIGIGKRFIVARRSEDFDPGERLPIILAHGRAFGSGEHETTRSCLEELEEIPLSPPTRVLDLGCGTGVLAIAAARLGSRFVVALDPAWEAVKTTQEGVQANRVEDAVNAVQGELAAIRDGHFDLVMANLYGDILLDLVLDLTRLLGIGAYLLLSGIRYEDAFDVKTEYTRAGCRLSRTRCLDEYTTLVFQPQSVGLESKTAPE